MHITIDKTQLNACLTARNAVSSRNTISILGNLLLEAGDGQLKATGTDLDTAIHATGLCTVKQPGSITAPAALLQDIISKLPEDLVTLEDEDGKLRIRCGRSAPTLLTAPAEDYPVVPTVSEGSSVELTQSQLKQLLNNTLYASAKDETRSLLMGVLFDASAKALTAVATDTHRLVKTTLHPAVEGEFSIIVPAKALQEVQKMLRDSGTVTITTNDSQVQFECNGVTLTSRLLDGQFPNFEKVIPPQSKTSTTFNRIALLNALRRAYIVAKSAAEKVVLNFTDGVCTLTAESQDIGKALEEVPVSFTGEFSIAVNARYLIELLGAVSAENVTLHLNTALSPIRVEVEGQSEFVSVLMPMQI